MHGGLIYGAECIGDAISAIGTSLSCGRRRTRRYQLLMKNKRHGDTKEHSDSWWTFNYIMPIALSSHFPIGPGQGTCDLILRADRKTAFAVLLSQKSSYPYTVTSRRYCGGKSDTELSSSSMEVTVSFGSGVGSCGWSV